MKIDLSEIAGTPGMHSTIEVDEPCPRDIDVVCTTPVKGRINFNNVGELLLITGHIKTDVKIECGRCLVDFTMPIEAEIEEEFRLERVGDAIQALPMEEEIDISLEVVKNNILDLDEMIRQDLLVELPIQPLCKPDCGGLCPTCGENLNVRQCMCVAGDVESPFHALAELLDEEDKDKEDQ